MARDPHLGPASAHHIQQLFSRTTFRAHIPPTYALLHLVLKYCRKSDGKITTSHPRSRMADQQPGAPALSGGGGSTGVVGGGDGGGLFQCGDCGRSYTRADHLARHVRSRKLSFRLCSQASLADYCRYRHAGKTVPVYYLSEAILTRVRCALPARASLIGG
jgi:hypothetical protein